MRATRLLLCLPLLSSFAFAAQAPTQDSAPITTLRTTVRRVILDVVVTDNKGKPVPGLKASDFQVAEDNAPQHVLSFDSHGFSEGMDFIPPSFSAGPPNTFISLPKTPERGPLYVILYDLVNTENADQIFARQQLVKFIAQKPAGARFAIFVFSDGLHLVQGFTSDPKELEAAIDPHSSRPHVPMVFLNGVNFGRGEPKTMQLVFSYIGRYLEGLPGRKNLIWISGDFPLSLFASDNEVASYQVKTREMLDLLARDQVSVYPVDARGVVVDEAHAPAGATDGGDTGMSNDSRATSLSAPAAGSAGSGTQTGVVGGATSTSSVTSAAGSAPAITSGAGYSLLTSSYAVAREVADVTGGHAFVSTNDVHDAILAATEDGTSFYTLTYAPSNPVYTDKARRILVTLTDGRKYHLAYRRAYYGTPPRDSPDAQPRHRADAEAPGAKPVTAQLDQPEVRHAGDSLAANMEHGAPIAHQIVFGAHIHAVGAPHMGSPEQMAALADVQSFSGKRDKRHLARLQKPVMLETVAIDYAVIARQFNQPGRSDPPSIELACAAYDPDGRLLNASVSQTVETEMPNAVAAPGEKPVYRVKQTLDVPADAGWLRLAMRDVRTDRIGAMEVKLPLAPETQAMSKAAGGVTP